MKRILFVLMTTAGGSIFPVASIALEIQNFKSGLVCEYRPNSVNRLRPPPWICFETETVYVTGQAECIYAGEPVQCTWYGFEFDYTNAKDDDEVSCIALSDAPVTIGDPKQIEKRDTQTFEFSVNSPPPERRWLRVTAQSRIGPPFGGLR